MKQYSEKVLLRTNFELPYFDEFFFGHKNLHLTKQEDFVLLIEATKKESGPHQVALINNEFEEIAVFCVEDIMEFYNIVQSLYLYFNACHLMDSDFSSILNLIDHSKLTCTSLEDETEIETELSINSNLKGYIAIEKTTEFEFHISKALSVEEKLFSLTDRPISFIYVPLINKDICNEFINVICIFEANNNQN